MSVFILRENNKIFLNKWLCEGIDTKAFLAFKGDKDSHPASNDTFHNRKYFKL